MAESVQSANSSGHIFPVEIRNSLEKQSPTPRTGQPSSIFEVDNSPIPSLASYLPLGNLSSLIITLLQLIVVIYVIMSYFFVLL